MSDLIERSEVLKQLWLNHKDVVYIDKNECARRIEAIPSARPKGEWIDKGRNLWECSNCKMMIYSESKQDRSEFYKWCSRCGADMRGNNHE